MTGKFTPTPRRPRVKLVKSMLDHDLLFPSSSTPDVTCGQFLATINVHSRQREGDLFDERHWSHSNSGIQKQDQRRFIEPIEPSHCTSIYPELGY